MARSIAAGSASPLSLRLPTGGTRRWLRALVGRLRNDRRLRFALVALAAAAVLLGGGWLWFRDSPFAAVQRVEISGVSGPGASAIEAALQRAARRTSTLDVDGGALRAAVARYPQVRALRVHASFPHELQIAVSEQLPVAALQGPGSARTAVAADGKVLGAALAASDLPAIAVPALPARSVRGAETLRYLSILGAAPAPLLRFVARVYEGPKGLTVALQGGMLVFFGDTARPHAKWASFARVVVAEGSADASYVDVRLPERPAVGAPGAGSEGQAAGGEGSHAGGAQSASLSRSGSQGAGESAGGSSASLVGSLEATLSGAAPTAPAGAQASSPHAAAEAAANVNEPATTSSQSSVQAGAGG
jgi:cell division septal protein FtsQ